MLTWLKNQRMVRYRTFQLRYLQAFGGKGITHVGKVGCGHAVKAVNNTLNTLHLLLATESVAILKRAGVEPEKAADVLARSSGMNLQIRDRLPQEVLSGKYSYGFALGLMAKDVRICAALLDAVDITDAALLRQVSPLVHAACEDNGADADYTLVSKYWQEKLETHLP